MDEIGSGTMTFDQILSRLGLPDWRSVWLDCLGRMRRWRVPARWSAAQWRDEAEAEGLVAAWEALTTYDPARHGPLATHLPRAILRSVRRLLRREGAYGRRCTADAKADLPPDRTSDPLAALLDRRAVEHLLDRLSPLEARLLRALFWDSRTETDVAQELGTSQAGVSRLKSKVMTKLRRWVEDRDEESVSTHE